MYNGMRFSGLFLIICLNDEYRNKVYYIIPH